VKERSEDSGIAEGIVEAWDDELKCHQAHVAVEPLVGQT
jgi:hypothetical protein